MSLGSVEVQKARARVFLVLREFIWNALAVSIVLPAFDNTSSLGFPPRHVVYPPGSMVTPWVTASRFPARNRESELKPTTFSSLLLFIVFLSLNFSCPNLPPHPRRDNTLNAACLGYSLITKIIYIYIRNKL